MPQLIEYQRTSPAFAGQIMPGMDGYRVCVRCVIDTTHLEAEFDADGICNYCHGFEQMVTTKRQPEAELKRQLDQKLARIKGDGTDSDYDCVLGISGGADSSYLALKCKDWGLRPLLVQFDNGWNTELANHNIQHICEVLDLDLHTHVVDWSEFRDLQLSFLKAGVTNFEAPSDHGIFACIYKTAASKNIRWLLTGVNTATESSFPITKKQRVNASYGYYYGDLVHLKAIHRRFGVQKLKTFPEMGFLRRSWMELAGRIHRFDPLNLMPYIKKDAIQELEERVGWKPYPGKHFESVITRFHQSYILPVKFGLDKRKLHLSGLIWSGQITREAAILELSDPPCPREMLKQDLEFFLKKMRLAPSEFDALIAAPAHEYREYPNIDWLFTLRGQVLKRLRNLGLDRF